MKFQPQMPSLALRTPSQAQTPRCADTSSLSTTPKTRARAPSRIPALSKSLRSVSLSRVADEMKTMNGRFQLPCPPLRFTPDLLHHTRHEPLAPP
jgi:hypothetical protein